MNTLTYSKMVVRPDAFRIRISSTLRAIPVFLPILIGLAAVIFVEYFYMTNPGIAPWLSDARSDELIILSIGLLLFGAGIHYRKGKIPFLLRTSGVFYYINRIENYALALLAGISIVFTLLSIVFIRPFPLFCVIICVTVSIAAIVVLTWLMEDTEIPERYEFDQSPKFTLDRSFRLLKLKDPSQKAGRD